jgi:hypothetical protein
VRLAALSFCAYCMKLTASLTTCRRGAGEAMDGRKDNGRKDAAKPLTQAERRQKRLEQELRANLQKRKAQARSRREDDAAPESAATEDQVPPDLRQEPRRD